MGGDKWERIAGGPSNCGTIPKITFFLSQSRDPAVQAAILAQLNAKYGSGVLPDAPKEMSKVSAAPPYPVAHGPRLLARTPEQAPYLVWV